tara:strand:+ start:1509 stop:1880 length:372 start_codon:yes stop_codon:yes gene_type:complete
MRYSGSMKDVSSIIDMVLNLQGNNGLSEILTDDNVKFANYIKNLLWLHTDPDYVNGTDKEIDDLIKNSTFDNKFLNGITIGMVLSLIAEGRPISNAGLHHSQLHHIYEACQAIILQTTDACDP